MKPGDWIGYDLATTTDDARTLAAKKLEVSEECIEIQQTGGAVLARERRGDE